MNIVQKRDTFFGHWVDVLHAQHGHIAFDYYQTMEKREGKDNVRILQQ
jgi:hypothetical protein